MVTCSIDKSSSVLDKLLNQILNYIGADCTVLGYFHYFIKKPRGSRSEVTALEIKIDDPRLEDLKFEDTYEITVALKIALGYLRKSRYFILSEIYAIIDTRTGRVVCTRELYDYDLKALGYEVENDLSGGISNLLHYNGGARLTEYMNRIRRRRLNTR